MKPTEIRDKINRIKEQLVLEGILVKQLIRDRDKKNFEERIAKQWAIIAEAEASIARIQHQHDTALEKYKKINQNRRREKKELKVLENYEKIECLKKIAEQLRKETDDGKKHSDS